MRFFIYDYSIDVAFSFIIIKIRTFYFYNCNRQWSYFYLRERMPHHIFISLLYSH